MTNDFQLIDGVLTFAPSVECLEEQQFFGNGSITKVILPSTLKEMEPSVFGECENLRQVVIEEGAESIGVAAFASCPALCDISLPSTLKTIGEGAFLYCDNLKTVTFPASLEVIGGFAFQSSGLVSLSVPPSVRLVGEQSFFECEALSHVDILGKDTQIGELAFGGDYQLHSGYIAPGYPSENSPAAELMYSLLWCSCPDMHDEKISRRAESFIRANEQLIMERILKYNNIPAMSGIAARGLLDGKNINGYLRRTLEEHQTELTALLLGCKRGSGDSEEEFEL